MHTNSKLPPNSIQPTIKYYGQILTINNNIVPYLKQVAYSQDRLMISDLGYEIEFDSQLKAYDNTLFKLLFREQLFYELESSHISIGLNILKNLPEKVIDHYQYIFSRLSIDKINDVLEDTAFYSFIDSSIRDFLFGQNMKQINQTTIIEESEAYIQALSILFLLEGSGMKLYAVFHQIASKLVYRKFEVIKQFFTANNKIVNNEKAREGLLGSCKNENSSQLKKIMKISLAFTYLRLIQIHIQDMIKEQRIPEQHIYNKQFLIFLKSNFKGYFEQCRQDLLITLSILSIDSKNSLWDNVINEKKPKKEILDKHQSLQQSNYYIRQNKDLFKEIILENYLGKDDKNWGSCLFLLQNLIKKDQNDSLDDFITDILTEINYRQIKVQLVDLACFHIRRIVAHRKVKTVDFKQFLSSFLMKLCTKIDEQYFKFCRKNKKRSKSLYVKLFSASKFIIFPKVNSVWISTILKAFTVVIQLRLIDALDGFNFQGNIQRLVQMSKHGKGITFGSLRTFAKAVERQSSINSQMQENGYLLPIEGSRIQGIRQILIKEMIL